MTACLIKLEFPMLEWFKTMDSLTLAPAPTDTFFPMKKRKIIIGIMHYPILAPLLHHVENPIILQCHEFSNIE